MTYTYQKLLRLILCLITVTCTGLGHARSSVATIKGHPGEALYFSYNYESQKEADIVALNGCRSEARKNGIGNLAKKCVIDLRGKAPGYGASTCGDNGCSYVTGFESGQSAVDAAYSRCVESYTNCQDRNITNWEDFAGFSKNTAAMVPAPASCRPRTSSISCTSACSNGNCVVTYTNGCKMRVQVSPSFDPFTNQWTYPSPSC